MSRFKLLVFLKEQYVEEEPNAGSSDRKADARPNKKFPPIPCKLSRTMRLDTTVTRAGAQTQMVKNNSVDESKRLSPIIYAKASLHITTTQMPC